MKNTGNAIDMVALRAGTYTVCLDETKTTDESYMNWNTFRLIRVSKGEYRVERKSNAFGNGQTWEGLGWVVNGTIQAGWVEGCVSIACLTLLARHFGLTWEHATVLRFPNARLFRPTGRKSAAPSLLRVTRDKNRDMERERVAALDFAGQMRARVEAR